MKVSDFSSCVVVRHYRTTFAMEISPTRQPSLSKTSTYWQGVKDEAAIKRGATTPSRGDRGAVILSSEIGRRVRSCDADGNTRRRRRWQGVKEEAAMKRGAAALSRGDRGAVILSSEIGRQVRSCDADGNTRRRRRNINPPLAVVQVLGLQFVKGHIWIESEGPGKGSTTTFIVKVGSGSGGLARFKPFIKDEDDSDFSTRRNQRSF
ncbi:uncharacterized protein HKW66_Vig0247630 [Vigna angularis]|uniref:Uncharacterized protein n=1 Tax=Phaseolus angularis TaxID=3914 RepID=A0A8T0KSK2_PHAAN|nr:uncharacterized protein HKW66_Vig0247630 [Vigna angularis]